MNTDTKTLLKNYYLAYRYANGIEKSKRLRISCLHGGWFDVTTIGSGYSHVQKSDLVKMTFNLNSRLPHKE